eukprot:455557-Rhodomonas_salina.1
MEALTRSLEQFREKPRTTRDDDCDDVMEITRSGSEVEELEMRQRKTPRRNADGMSTIVDAFVRAIEERLGDCGSWTSDEPATESVAVARIARTHPAL